MNSRESSYNASWKKTSVEMRNIHDCVICGETSFKKKECHHIDFDKKNDAPGNLIVLCSDCHVKVHKGTIKLHHQMEEEKSKTTAIQEKLNDVNQLIAPYQLAYVNVSDCELLKQNAHYMEKEMLDKLANNIAEDGFLSQLPFALKQPDGKYLILSGNHRIRASMKAGLEYVLLLYVEDIPKEKQIAYQISHNSLVGKDDMKMLKDIFQQIDSLEAKEFSGVSDLDFINVDNISFPAINDKDIDIVEMKFLFVESKTEDAKRIIATLEKQKLDENSGIIFGNFEAFIKQLTAIKGHFGIKSNTVAFSKMIEICAEHIIKAEENGRDSESGQTE